MGVCLGEIGDLLGVTLRSSDAGTRRARRSSGLDLRPPPPLRGGLLITHLRVEAAWVTFGSVMDNSGGERWSCISLHGCCTFSLHCIACSLGALPLVAISEVGAQASLCVCIQRPRQLIAATSIGILPFGFGTCSNVCSQDQLFTDSPVINWPHRARHSTAALQFRGTAITNRREHEATSLATCSGERHARKIRPAATTAAPAAEPRQTDRQWTSNGSSNPSQRDAVARSSSCVLSI